jgi:putative phosphoesterase
MRIAVISDTHLPKGSRALPRDCVEQLRAADLILHAGDLASVAFLEQLQAFGPPVAAVHGNIDEPALRQALPRERVVEAAGTRIGVVHTPGPKLGRRERLLERFPGCRAVVYGHTHVPELELVDGVWLLNPGSPTERRGAPVRTMLELTVADGEIAPRLIDLGP